MAGIQGPTKVRLLSGAEYGVVTPVFGSTLPMRGRIYVTNAAGVDGRPFTIPTSLVSTLLGVNPVTFLANVAAGYLGSVVNVGYFINAGAAYDKLATTEKPLLVHEMTHVWQGENSWFALSYVFNSVYNQCVRGNAYSYIPGRAWSSYNVEQQASIVEDWYASGQSSSSALFPYIRDHVRTGDA
jgi:hypothetical protein